MKFYYCHKRSGGMKTDYLKWMVKKAGDEWHYYQDGIHYTPKSEENSVYAIYIKEGFITDGIAHYELLSQKVIEGINENSLSIGIVVLKDAIQIWNCKIMNEQILLKTIYYKDCNSIRAAKEVALLYIYEQEANDEARPNG